MPGHAEVPAGSPAAGEPAFLAVGKVRRPHGVRGEALVEVYTTFPERIQPGLDVFLGESHLPLKIASRRSHNQGLLLGFEGITSPEQMGRYRNQVLYVARKKSRKLAEDEYFQYELMDLVVLDDTGRNLGRVTGIMETGANDVYEVTDESGREILLPAIADVILDVDLDEKKMLVHLLPGLINEEE